MEEHENAGGVTARNTRPLGRNTAGIDGRELDIVGHRPDRADFVETLTPVVPADRPGF
jgi:hypothetical protein